MGKKGEGKLLPSFPFPAFLRGTAGLSGYGVEIFAFRPPRPRWRFQLSIRLRAFT